MYRRCVFVRCWPQKSHSYTLNNVQRTITFIGRGHCLPGDVSVRARFIYGILTWERRFDKWSSLRVRLYFSVRRRTLVKRRWPKTHARARARFIGQSHCRRWRPHAQIDSHGKPKWFLPYYIFSYVSLSCCGSRDYIMCTSYYIRMT